MRRGLGGLLGEIDADALQLWREHPMVGGEVQTKRAGDFEVRREIADVLERAHPRLVPR